MRLEGSTLLAIAIVASGCGAGWRQVPVVPTAIPDGAKEVRVTRDDGTRIIVTRPRISGDSLFGEVDGQSAGMAMADVRRLALPDASSSQNSAGTVTLLAAVGALALAWLTIIAVAAE